jgi:beta-lysine 5,6-aminomutase beta subunit
MLRALPFRTAAGEVVIVAAGGGEAVVVSGPTRLDALDEAQERSADAILVSQVVTQKQVHARQLTKLVDLLEAEGVRDRYVLVCGGPRLSNTFAKELGYDAGFGPGSTPSTVAGWIAQELVARRRPV